MYTRLIPLLLCLLIHCSINAQTQCVGRRIAPLEDTAWKCSQWISVKDAPVVTGNVSNGSRTADGANWFATTVHNEKKVTSARWMSTSLGIHIIYINGRQVGEEVLKPGFTSCFKTKRSFTYDITKAFRCKPGEENTLAVQVTPGWWADKIVTPDGNYGMYGTKCAYRGVLELTYKDGSKELLGTDTEHWRATIAGPVKHAGIFDGETYDAQVPFSTPAVRFSPSGEALIWGMDNWPKPEVNTEFKGEILPSTGAEVYHRFDLALSPVKAYVWQKIEGENEAFYGKVVKLREYSKGQHIQLHRGETLVVDFGQNCAAVPQFVFSAKSGTKLTCLPGELLNDSLGAKSRGMDGPEGSVHRLNLRTHQTHMRLDYTFGRSPEASQDQMAEVVTYLPQCTFFGYRFISVTATDDVMIESVKSIPVTSISKNMETGYITTGSKDINQLISNTLWGMRSNYLSIPTDCPQRNERLGWTADTQVFSETGTFFANTRLFFHKWLRDLRDSQSDEGGYPGVAPHAQYASWNGDMMRVGWADAGIIVPWTIWKQFGDLQVVRESWASMEKYMKHVAETKYDHNTLKAENGNYQWADWLSYEPLESCGGSAFGSNGPLPEAIDYWNYLSASYWLLDAQMMADMAKSLEYETHDGQTDYEKMAREVRSYIREQFFTPNSDFKSQILNTMQTPILFALRNGILEGEAKEYMISRLRQNFKEHDGCLQTGFLGTSILMQTLTDNGMSDIAYDLLFQHKNPSWLYSIDNGATTIWERWNSYTLEHGMGPRGMNSFNHYAYGSVCQWIWETVAGINADTRNPGFKHIILRPVPDKRLGHIDASYMSPSGLIRSSWHYKGSKWIWQFTIPKGCSATVVLPNGETKEYKAGRHTIKR